MDYVEKDHPNYGEIIKTPDGRLVCHICGKAFNKLGAYVVQKHKITSYDYKKIFGLNVSIGLISDNHREHLHDMAIKNYDVVVKENLIKKGINTRYVIGSKGRTREQLSEQSLRMLKKRRFNKK